MVLTLAILTIVLALMLIELRVSRRNERALRARGAVAPPDPVYPAMRVAYPGAFAVMAVEGALWSAPPADVVAAGVLVFALAKLFKVWVIRSLGVHWTYTVLVLPGAPLVAAGPYRLLRHPNYVAVAGELIGMAIMTGAVYTGPPATLLFGWLMWRRVQAEERALGMR